ncbi:MAG TPA: GFA family protein [Croceibacterium sp.]
MTASATGGCLCGAVRYSVDGAVGPAGYCHCTDCRRVTGSAFNISAPVRLADLAVTGDLRSHAHPAESGTILTRHFCATCGSPIYAASPAHPDIVYVRAGTLDDPDLVRPALEAWCGSRVAWSVIPQGLQQTEKGRFA